MLENLKYFDLFGSQIHFSINGRGKYYSMTGGIMSILSLIMAVILLNFFSMNYFKRLTRKDSVVTINTGHKKIKFGEEKVWLPWAIGDYGGNPVNFEGQIFPIARYYYGERSPTSDGFNLSYKVLTWKRCNETSFVEQRSNINVEINRLYCLDMDDIIMGGDYFLANFVYQVEFNFYICRDGGNIDNNISNCNSFTNLSKVIGEGEAWHFEIYYPEIQYQPSNIKEPMSIFYNAYYYHFSRFSNKIDRLYLQQYKLNDDIGWIFNENKNTTFWGLRTLSGASYASSQTGEPDILGGSTTSRLYSINIFISPYTTYYQRTYSKLFDVISEVFPLLNTVIVLFNCLASKMKNAELEKKHLNNLFEHQLRTAKMYNNSKIMISSAKNNNFLCKSNMNMLGNINNNLLPEEGIKIKKKDISLFNLYYFISEFCSFKFKRCIPSSFFSISRYLHNEHDIYSHIKMFREFTKYKSIYCTRDLGGTDYVGDLYEILPFSDLMRISPVKKELGKKFNSFTTGLKKKI